MCQFKSGIITYKHKDVVHDVDNDSHEDLHICGCGGEAQGKNTRSVYLVMPKNGWRDLNTVESINARIRKGRRYLRG